MTPWTCREIVSEDDPALLPFAQLTDMQLRRQWEPEQGIFIAEGMLVIERVAKQGLQIESVLTSSRWLDRLGRALGDWTGEVLVAEEPILERITGYRVHRGALAAARRPALQSVRDVLQASGPLLVLEELVDATNVGLAARSAVALGVDQVLLSPGCADPFYRRAVKASMGSVLNASWARSRNWPEDLRDLVDERVVIALTPYADRTLSQVLNDVDPARVALAVGSEGPGLSENFLRACSVHARIPMSSGVDSLNVGAATAVACYALQASRGDL